MVRAAIIALTFASNLILANNTSDAIQFQDEGQWTDCSHIWFAWDEASEREANRIFLEEWNRMKEMIKGWRFPNEDGVLVPVFEDGIFVLKKLN